jgi:ATP-dependent RNA helicase DDX49/DBP8
MDFRTLGLCSWLAHNASKLGINNPTEVQKQCIPPILDGRNVLAAAQTGSGKTAAFALPILQKLQEDPYGVFALCLTPTRELALQIQEQFEAFSAGTMISCCAIIGGEDMKTQSEKIISRPHILCATPGRLLDHFTNNGDVVSCFRRVAILVLDEADRLLNPNFNTTMRCILSSIPIQRQTLMFSATITSSITAIENMKLQNLFHVEVKNNETRAGCKQSYCFMPSKMKGVYLFNILMLLLHSCKSVIVFVNTIEVCEMLTRIFNRLDIPSVAIHSLNRQRQRTEALIRFRSMQIPVLFATDVASRGIDVPAVDAVVNYDTPASDSDYIHRIGRTARAERTGEAVTMVTQYDVQRLLDIEKAIRLRMNLFEIREDAITLQLSQFLAAKRAVRLQMSQDFDTRLATRKRQRELT